MAKTAIHGKQLYVPLAVLFLVGIIVSSASADWQAEWEKVKSAAKVEGKVVVNVPPSPEVRKALEATFPRKFGIDLELVPGSSALINPRVEAEAKGGVRYFDVITNTADRLDRLVALDAVAPLEPYWILSEVKDPKLWWGGHIWLDDEKKYAYSPYAYVQVNVWYNSRLIRPEQLRSYKDLLDPEWKGKIGLFDPRLGGAGLSNWSFMWKVLGEDFLRKLAGQQLLIGERRVVAEALAKGKISISLGVTDYTFAPFIKAGLPVKPLPAPREGWPLSVGNGGPVIIKNHPHPNAAKVYVNWLLSREGQALYSNAIGHATRRFDVDTRWAEELGGAAAKDVLKTVEEFWERETQSAVGMRKVRGPARELAREVLP